MEGAARRLYTMRIATLILLSLALTASAEADTKDISKDKRLPEAKAFHRHIQDVMATYPTDGSHAYHWPKTGTWSGNVRTLTYGGKVFLKGDPQGRCYCCGLTFEVFFKAFERWCKANKRPFRILDLKLKDLHALKRAWFGSDGNRKTLLNAIESYHLGKRITKWKDAKRGDFVQFWRHTGSGHSVIFDQWVKRKGRIVGLTYWSTQGSTKGIGTRSEFFGTKESGKGLKRDEVYNQQIGTLSKGFKRRVGLAQAILHDPDVLILDEPTDGLDPNQKHQVRELIGKMAKDKAIVISTHLLEEVDAVCTRAVVIARGRKVADGTPADLERRSAYYNAVSVRLHPDHVDNLKSALDGIGDIDRIEVATSRSDGAHVIVVSKNGATIIETVNARMNDRGISVEQLYVERGRLDDVFRQITADSAGGAA